MLFGSLEPNSGEIRWNGEAVRIASPGVAQKARHRHGVPAFLAVRGADGGREHRAVARRRHADRHHRRQGAGAVATATACRSIRIRWSATCRSANASASRSSAACCRRRTCIILDEPTSVLTPQEADKLFETLERLRSEGKSILYISHRLEEVKRHVRRARPSCATARWSATAIRARRRAASLARMMVGSEVHEVVRDRSTHAPGRAAARDRRT